MKAASTTPATPELPTARDFMTANALVIDKDMTILQAAQLLLNKGISNAPVIEKDFTRQILVGFVSEKDLLQCYANGEFYQRPDLKVGEVMRRNPVCVKPTADLFTLAAIFIQHGYRHVPVTEAHLLHGMVSRRDVLRALMQHYRQWTQQDPENRVQPDLRDIFTHRFMIS